MAPSNTSLIDEGASEEPKAASSESFDDEILKSDNPIVSHGWEKESKVSLSPTLAEGNNFVSFPSDLESTKHLGDEIVEVSSKRPAEQYLFDGEWIWDDSYPLYKSEACPFLDEGFRCQENGRPDQGYLKWRWQSSVCNTPRFNATDILERLRGSRVVFVGDSIGRNQWESMICMLAEAVHNKSRIYEVNGQPITKHTGYLSFRFEDYKCTIEYYRSPFLVPQGRPPRNHSKGVLSTLRVDTMDWTSKLWLGADVLIFNAGHWWNYEKTIRSGCYFQVRDRVNESMDVHDAFSRAMRTWREWVTKEVDPAKTQVFFRTYAPVHFRGGTWKTGGQCHQETEPWPEGTRFDEEEPWTNSILTSEIKRFRNKDHARLLNITHLSNYRKDAHSSIYHVGKDEPRPMHRQDCSHWCLPGLPDTWNELLFASLFASGKGKWQLQTSTNQ